MKISTRQTHSVSYTPPTYPSNPPSLIDELIAATTPLPTKQQAYMEYLRAGLNPYRTSHADLALALRQAQRRG